MRSIHFTRSVDIVGDVLIRFIFGDLFYMPFLGLDMADAFFWFLRMNWRRASFTYPGIEMSTYIFINPFHGYSKI